MALLIALGFTVVVALWGDVRSVPVFITIMMMIIIPFFFAILHTKLFRITVSGDIITVRRTIGISYSFYVLEIVRVDLKIAGNQRMGVNRKFVIRTASRRVAFATLNTGFKEMAKYIEINVDHNKIKVHGVSLPQDGNP